MKINGWYMGYGIKILNYFMEGAHRHGCYTRSMPVEPYQAPLKAGECDLVVTVGFTIPIQRIHERCRELGIPSLCITDGFVQIPHTERYGPDYRFGITRSFLGGYGDHRYTEDYPDGRWRDLRLELKPWKSGGETIILAHQPCDEQDNWNQDLGIPGRQEFFQRAAERCLELGYPVILCRHPRGESWYGMRHDLMRFFKSRGINTKGRLPEELEKNPRGLVTFNSSAAVGSVIQGVPALISETEKTMADPVLVKGLDNLDGLIRPDRQPWVNWLAYQQWTAGEMRSGEAFSHYLDPKNSPGEEADALSPFTSASSHPPERN
jgi:hypothetical protein